MSLQIDHRKSVSNQLLLANLVAPLCLIHGVAARRSCLTRYAHERELTVCILATNRVGPSM